jgi:hypothetical protein
VRICPERAKAKSEGAKHYFTGEPCKRGHIAKRFTSDAGCIECKRNQSIKWASDHREEWLKIMKRHNAKRHDDQIEYRKKPEVKERTRERNRAWRKLNPDKQREYTKRWMELHPETRKSYLNRPNIKARMRAVAKQWAKDHPERIGLWAKNHPDKRRAISGRRYAKKRLVRVPWADDAAINALYAEAERLTRETGIPHEVDHIYPIQGKTVTGLHHQDNLRVVPRSVNRSKGNKMPSVEGV